MEKDKDILEILLDKENNEPIVLVNDRGRSISFSQIAVIPREQRIYCILKPIDKIKGMKDDEALVFYVEETKSKSDSLLLEKDEMRAIEVFEEYYKLLEENMEE